MVTSRLPDVSGKQKGFLSCQPSCVTSSANHIHSLHFHLLTCKNQRLLSTASLKILPVLTIPL